MSNDEWVTIEGSLVTDSDKAYCVDVGDGGIWVPISLCRNVDAAPGVPNSPITFEILQWQAEEKGLI